MNVFTRTLAAALLVVVPTFAHAETASPNADLVALAAAVDALSAKLDKLDASVAELKSANQDAATSPATSPAVATADSNQAVVGLTFTQRNPMSDCTTLECYGAKAIGRAQEMGRLSSVIMREPVSCRDLAREGVSIPCQIVDNIPADVVITYPGGCDTLKCFAFAALDDMSKRNVIKHISLPTKFACQTLDDMAGHYTGCRGADDTSLVVKPLDADD